MKFVVLLLVFFVASCGGGGGGDYSPGAPDAPLGVTPMAGPETVTIGWDNVKGATSYNLYYSQTAGVTKATGIRVPSVTSSHVVTPLTNGTEYFFVVTAENANGESAVSTEVSAIPTPIPPPPAPTGITAAASSNQATINWDNATGATSYNLYYSETAGVTKATGIRVPSVTSPHVVTPLINGTEYFFVVTAVNANGESAESSQVTAMPTDAPTGVTAAPGSGQATISWSAVRGAASYNIYYSTSSPVSKATGTKVAGVTSPSGISPLTNGTEYYFVVTAVNSSGESAISSEVSAKPLPDPPPPVPTGVAVAPGYGQAAISWSPVAGATTYNIYYSTTSPVAKATGTKVAGVTSPGIVTGLTIGTRHFFVVTSENADAESGISSEVSAIISAEYIAIGDSITFGSNDDIPADGFGYEPILANLLPATVANEGVGGVSSADGADFISVTLSKFPSAKYYLVLYGTNDADTCCGPPVSKGSYKANMQNIISAILAAGKKPYLSKVPYTSNTRYSITSIQGYNVAINELVAENGITITPPDFYTLFQDPSLLSTDGLHPNGTGFHSMANLWSISLTP
jgi:lysophospholipase L1-like esterase/fibronectin type 3 domain-containing protein